MKIRNKKAFWEAIFVTTGVVIVMSIFYVMLFTMEWRADTPPILFNLVGAFFIFVSVGLAKLCGELIMEEVDRD